jgi:hypothetical protein
MESGYMLQNYYSSVQAPAIKKYGLFNTAYIPKHLKLIFTGMPDFLPQFPFVRPNPEGMNIWLTTPAFFALITANWLDLLVILARLSAFLISLPAMIYTATGWVHRYTLDYLPFLFVAIAITVSLHGRQIRIRHEVKLLADFFIGVCFHFFMPMG